MRSGGPIIVDTCSGGRGARPPADDSDGLTLARKR